MNSVSIKENSMKRAAFSRNWFDKNKYPKFYREVLALSFSTYSSMLLKYKSAENATVWTFAALKRSIPIFLSMMSFWDLFLNVENFRAHFLDYSKVHLLKREIRFS